MERLSINSEQLISIHPENVKNQKFPEDFRVYRIKFLIF